MFKDAKLESHEERTGFREYLLLARKGLAVTESFYGFLDDDLAVTRHFVVMDKNRCDEQLRDVRSLLGKPDSVALNDIDKRDGFLHMETWWFDEDDLVIRSGLTHTPASGWVYVRETGNLHILGKYADRVGGLPLPPQSKSAGVPPPPKVQVRFPFPKATIEVWEKAGARVYWGEEREMFFFKHTVETPGQPGWLPWLEVERWEQGSLKRLPPPESPFGLTVATRDVGVKDLFSLKQLTVLHLPSTYAVDSGMKALTGHEQLASLTLSGTRITDAGLKELASIGRLSVLRLARCSASFRCEIRAAAAPSGAG